MNTKFKGVRGPITFTKNESFRPRWLICGRGIARILDEFEGTLNPTSNEVQEQHNSTISSQSSFQKDFEILL